MGIRAADPALITTKESAAARLGRSAGSAANEEVRSRERGLCHEQSTIAELDQAARWASEPVDVMVSRSSCSSFVGWLGRAPATCEGRRHQLTGVDPGRWVERRVLGGGHPPLTGAGRPTSA
jgi:hypothetical protein